jgi:hypothetical protein
MESIVCKIKRSRGEWTSLFSQRSLLDLFSSINKKQTLSLIYFSSSLPLRMLWWYGKCSGFEASYLCVLTLTY